jgi:hypothetical protein
MPRPTRHDALERKELALDRMHDALCLLWITVTALIAGPGCSDDADTGAQNVAGTGAASSTQTSTGGGSVSTGGSSGGANATSGASGGLDTCPPDPGSLDDAVCETAAMASCKYDIDDCPTEYACRTEDHQDAWIPGSGVADGEACADLGKTCSWEHSLSDGGPYLQEVLRCDADRTWHIESCPLGFDAASRSCSTAPEAGESCGDLGELDCACTMNAACGTQTIHLTCDSGLVVWTPVDCG